MSKIEGADLAVIMAWAPKGTPALPVSGLAAKQGDVVTWYGQKGSVHTAEIRGSNHGLASSDLVIVKGDSGSPVLNHSGEIVGVVTCGMVCTTDRKKCQMHFSGDSVWPATCATSTPIRGVIALADLAGRFDIGNPVQYFDPQKITQ